MEVRDFTPRPYQGPMMDFMLENERCAIWAGMGLGKQQPNSEPVLTPDGWVPMGSLKVGDYVIGADGHPTQVLGVFPQGVHETVKVTFTDGAFCHVGWEHLWYVQSPQQKSQGKVGYVMTTRQLVDSDIRRKMGNRTEAYWHIPVVKPVAFKEKALPIEPYTLGVLLGDGALATGATVCTDKEIIDTIGANLLREHETCEYVGYGSIAGLAPALRDLGLLGTRFWEKFVPEQYLRGSVAQRHALLQGLLDTDGSPLEDGGVEFSSTSARLIEAVVELTQSLGGIARVSDWRVTRCQTGEGRLSCRVNVKLPADLPTFRLPRKLAKWAPPTKYPPARKIAEVEVVGSEEATCIKVAAADSLYVTRDYVVTHNTSATLMALDVLMMAEDDPILVIAPLRVANDTWVSEVDKWAQTKHLVVVPITGTAANRQDAVRRKAPIYTVNYESLPWLIEYWGDRWPYRTVVADESTKLKSFRLKQGGKRAQALAKVAFTRIKRFIQLTGTPSPNGLLDLWGQIWFLDRGARLGRTFSAFRDRWFQKDYSGHGYRALPHAQAEIHDAIRDICLTVEAKDWFDLHQPIVNNILVDLPVRARRAYQEMEKQMFTELESGHSLEAVNAAARTMKCLQLANGAAYTDESGKEWTELHDQKIQALDEILEESAGAPVLVAYHFKSDLQRIMKAYPHAINVGTDAGLRRAKAGEGRLWLGHPASMGHGVDGLQYHCNQLVFFGHWWDLEQRLQMIERVGPTRQFQAGMDRPVFIHNILARNTVDELVLERVQTKREVQDILMDAMKRRKKL